jgi:negative regulator of sigma E activity
MSGQERDSQLSAMYDGELPAAECELLARRLSRDEALRREWGHYALIGAVIRGEPLAGQSSGSGRADLAARVRAEIARSGATVGSATDDEGGQSEAAALSAGATPGARAPRLPRWAVPVSGVGIAAGVAAAAILWLRFDAPGPATAAGVVSAPVRAMPEEIVLPAPAPAPTPTPAPASVAGTVDPKSRAPDSYTVPPPSDAPAVLLGGAALANFVVAHSEVATPLLRRNVISALVADPEARLEEIDAPPAGGLPPPASTGGGSASGAVR